MWSYYYTQLFSTLPCLMSLLVVGFLGCHVLSSFNYLNQMYHAYWSYLSFQESERVVSKKEGIDFAREYGCLYLECSAKTRVNVEQCFEELVLKVCKILKSFCPTLFLYFYQMHFQLWLLGWLPVQYGFGSRWKT